MQRNVDEEVMNLSKEYPGLGALPPSVVYLMGCMGFPQFCCTWRSLADPETFCPFCPAELTRRERRPLEFLADWMLLENEFPRPDTERMLLVVPRSHLIDTGDLSERDAREMWLLVRIARKYHGFSGGGLVMRDGDPRDHAGTIEHLHLNLIKPMWENDVRLPLAKKVEGPYGHREDYERLRLFVKTISERGGVEWLFSREGIEETQPKKLSA
jgi:diadenosine tetraphosphate (Ap4A) HIT family hydrolase